MTKFARFRFAAYAIIFAAVIGLALYPYATDIKEFVDRSAGDIFFFGLVLFVLVLFLVNFSRRPAGSDETTLKLLWRQEEEWRHLDNGSDIINDPVNASISSNIFHDHQRFGK